MSMNVRLVRSWPVLLAAVALAAACGGKKSPNEPTPSCSFAVSPAAASFAPDGGTGGITVTSPAGCAWTAAASGGWVSITSGANGSGNGTVAYAVSSHAGTDARSATVTIAGQVHTVSQAGRPETACSYDLSPSSAAFGKDAADGTFGVSAPAGCAWTASSSAAWLTVTAGERGSGSGQVAYSITRNLEITERTAQIRVADRTFSLVQGGDTGGCQYSVAPVDVDVCMPGRTATAAVTTQDGCTWTAASGAPWLTVRDGSEGAGSGVITFEMGDNYDAPRSSTIFVRWPTPTAGQNIRVAQAGCQYAVSPSTFAFAAAGGPGTFDVFQQSDPIQCGGPLQDRCVWSAVSDAPWITVTNPSQRSGDDRVSFTIAANPGPAPRSGTIAVRDKVVTITQAGQ
jgi:hypothetical protein